MIVRKLNSATSEDKASHNARSQFYNKTSGGIPWDERDFFFVATHGR